MRYTWTQGVEHHDDNIRRSFLVGVPLVLGLLSLGPLNPSKLGSPYQPLATAQSIKVTGQTATSPPKPAAKVSASAAAAPSSGGSSYVSSNATPATTGSSGSGSSPSSAAKSASANPSASGSSSGSSASSSSGSSGSTSTLSVGGVSVGVDGKPLLTTSSLGVLAN